MQTKRVIPGKRQPAHSAGSSLFRSRLRPPTNPELYLQRPRLLRLLDEAVSGPITLVVAPAGAGKTSLLVDWCAASPVQTAWVSLDETDQDRGQLWTAVAVALAELGHVGPSIHRPRSFTETVEALFPSGDDDHPTESVLILDDVHLIDDEEAVGAFLSQLLRFLPPWLHIMLLSRRTPKLPIDRLRARGQLTEVRFAELRFSVEEAEELLVRLAPSLDEDRLRAAVGRTDGWAAGLRLVALAARADQARRIVVPRTDAEDVLIADYVWHEVLAVERPVVDMLLDTCVVRRVNASLAETLTARPDAGKLLLEAEERGLFVTRLGTSGWVEVHSVVREELLAEAMRRSPRRIAQLHSRAAKWFEERGEVGFALEHWVLGRRSRDALRLLALYASELHDTGREATVARTLEHIPPNLAHSDFTAMLDFAWCELLVDRGRFLESVRQATVLVDRVADPAPTSLARLAILQSIAATVRGDWAQGGRLAERAVQEFGATGPSDPVGRVGRTMIARDVALSERWDDGLPQLEEARFELGRLAERGLAYEGTRALGEAMAGRPIDALRVAAGVRDFASVNSMTILRADLGIAEAIAHRELGDRVRAVAELALVAESEVGPVNHAKALALMELTQLRLDEGDLDAAEQTFARAHELVSREFSGSGGLDWLARVGTLVSLAVGELRVARNWSDQVDDSFWGNVSAARVHLYEGRHGEAITLLEGSGPRCVRHHVVRDLLLARTAASHQEAVDFAIRAVQRATSTGLLQTVASEGPDVLELLEINAWAVPREWLDRVRQAASARYGGSLADPSRPGEHLTDRELEVLRMLPSRLTLREIAGQLFISLNTLKFHLRVIYQKLGVGSREEAANVARRMTSLRRPLTSSARQASGVRPGP